MKPNLKPIVFMLSMSVLQALSTAQESGQTLTTDIPSEFQIHYTQLDNKLDEITTYLAEDKPYQATRSSDESSRHDVGPISQLSRLPTNLLGHYFAYARIAL